MPFEYRNEQRDDVRELFVVLTAGEVRAAIECIDAKGRGKPIGELVLADAHGWDAA